VHCLESSATRACDIDAIWIDVGSGQQIIERSDSIPNFPTRQVCAGEVRQITQHRVLSADQVVTAFPGFSIPELAALALSDWIPTDDHVSTLH
jgi:hypothetical protein